MEQSEKSDTLAPPAVASLRTSAEVMQRSLSEDIREERDELREAAEQTLNVFMDLNLDGTIRWVSPSWVDVLGRQADSVQGTAISDLIEGEENKSVFADTTASMKEDDSSSQIVRFSMRLGPHSKLLPSNSIKDQEASAVSNSNLSVKPDHENMTEKNATDALSESASDIIDLEAQGIMVYDTASGIESHTMWMIRPWIAPREIKINLPPLIVNSLGSGAEILASYLTQLAESGLEDVHNHPPPQPVLCRICERQIPPWWFEKHTDLCLQEHTAEMDVQLAQESLTEHRHAIVKVLDALEARKSRSLAVDASPPLPVAEYKGMSIGPTPSSTSSPSATSATSSPSPVTGRSCERSSGFGHARGRSFAVRRPQARIVELLLDLCDTAMEISTPAIKEMSSVPGEFRTQSPQSESRISQVMQWQSPSSNTLEQEQGLALLCADTEKVAKAKVETVLLHRRVIEYAERIRIEFAVIVQDCIERAMHKAARIAAGELSDSTEDGTEADDDIQAEEGKAERDGGIEEASQPSGYEEAFFAGSFDAPSSLAIALEKAKISDDPDQRRSSVAVSQTSGSPLECPTPKSHRGAIGIVGRRDSRRESILLESDAGDSDGSIRSSLVPRPPPRTESPMSEYGDLRRQASSRQRQRRSLIPSSTGADSPRRQESPSRSTLQGPSSPLRISKPRSVPFQSEGLASPEASPMLPGSDFGSPYLTSQHVALPQPHHHQLHHRRQSSLSLSTSGDIMSRQGPSSPRLSAVGTAPMARAVPPSIKDFEVIKPISKGAFGSVYLSKKKSTGEYFAIKVLKKADMVAKNQVTNVKAERAIMMWQGESDFVAKLYWTFSSKDYLYLVMEYLNGGDCASLIKVLGCLPEDWVKKYLGEVVLGVEHLHSRGIVHRDLKPDNLLIDQKGHLKLTDFGLSRMGLVGRQKRALNSGTTEPAPDLLKQGPFARSASIASSRSASLDLYNINSLSPGGTPQMTPSDSTSNFGLPSYFNLASTSAPQEPRRVSGQRSDSGGSDALSNMISSLSLNDLPTTFVPPATQSPQNETTEGFASDSPDLAALQPTSTQTSSNPDQGKGAPPQVSMPPPNWALFDPQDTNRRFVGTPDYLAPETIRGEPQDETSDWWSVGCIMFEFLYGIPPFNADEAEQVFENILARRIHWPETTEDEVSPDAKDLINKLLCMNPGERLGANKDDKYASGGEEIRNHLWFAGVKWDTLLQDEAQFVPQLENPEDTEYFDARGATLQSFQEETEDQASSPNPPGSDYHDRPHDALSRVRSQTSSMKRGLMPLHIPPHVRDLKSRRLSEPVVSDDFGNFAFKNLPVLEKANKDVIQKLRAEALAAQNKQPQAISPGGLGNAIGSPSPLLEGSPVLPPPAKQQIQRALSNAKATQGPQSPSGTSQANSSPSRVSQPSSPLLVSFHAAPDSRRKPSGNGHPSLLHSSSTAGSLQPSASTGLMEVPRVPPSLQKAATSMVASSPIKGRGIPPPLPLSPQKAISTPRQTSNPTSRARSLTVGSQEGSPVAPDILSHRNRRSQVFDMSPSSSDNEGDKANALLLRVQRRRQSSRRMSQIALDNGPVFRPLDVLICEDHPVSRMVMEKLLEKLRCRTISATSGPEAVRFAMSDIKFDIIFMEYKLPQISGADVARMIRDTTNTNSHTPIVAITAYLKELQARQHFDSLIEKPISSSKLAEVLSTLCQWKPPLPNQCSLTQPALQPALQLLHPTPSALRQSSLRLEDSPTSGSSICANRPGSSFRGSSRGDSIGSSMFGDSESFTTDDMPAVAATNRKLLPQGDWEDSSGGGLGISQEELGNSDVAKATIQPTGAGLASATSTERRQALDQRMNQRGHSSSQTVESRMEVPGAMAVHAPVPLPLPRRSLEKFKARRDAIEKRRIDGSVDSADDEDDELGMRLDGAASTSSLLSVSSGSSSSGVGSSGTGGGPSRQLSPTASRQHFRSKSVLPSSKLGIEMMRANSHDSVVIHNESSESASTMTLEPGKQMVTAPDEASNQEGLAKEAEADDGDEYDEDADTTVIHTPPDFINNAEEFASIDSTSVGATPKVIVTPTSVEETTSTAGTAFDDDPTPKPRVKSTGGRWPFGERV